MHVSGKKNQTNQKKAVTCSCAHAPWGQPVGCGEAVEYTDILRRQELHKLGIVEHFLLAVQDGRCLVRDVNDLPRDEGDSYSKNILMAQRKQMFPAEFEIV